MTTKAPAKVTNREAQPVQPAETPSAETQLAETPSAETQPKSSTPDVDLTEPRPELGTPMTEAPSAHEQRLAAQVDRDLASSDRSAVTRALREISAAIALAERDSHARAVAGQMRDQSADQRDQDADLSAIIPEQAHFYRDDLTGALTRGAGTNQLSKLRDRAYREQGALAIAFVDVDHLKVTNDEHGHGAGDSLLRAVGVALEAGLRSYDVVVRYGGDEFVCALPGACTEDAVNRMAECGRLLTNAIPEATFSVGIAQFDGRESLIELIARADAGMYSGRESSRRVQQRPRSGVSW
jgi:diguanylate cyclase (GGDEF)-like protein